MRPRLIAVDDEAAGAEVPEQPGASMRPRLIAVDDRCRGVRPTSLSGFNEATAYCRG